MADGKLVFQTELDSKGLKSGLSGAEGAMEKTGGKASKMFGLAKAGAVAAGAAVVKIGTDSVRAFSDYEQLAGGVKKLFGDASDTVMQNAQKAYQTAGMSANQYMEQATSFSASLIGSLGGDTQKAAEQADVAMRAISDNVNVFGSNMGDVQNAFQGFAKQNYTMLDNLKLGYGGTKSEMERLIADANTWAEANGKAADLSIDSFSDVVTAIDYIQQKQGIAGTTAKEAATTIQGSFGMMQASWQNLLVAMSDPKADVGKVLGEFTRSVGTFAKNLLPIINNFAETFGQVVVELAPELVKMIGQLLPTLVVAASNLIVGVAKAIPALIVSLIQAAAQIIPQLIAMVATALPQIIQAIVSAIPMIITTVVSAIPQIVTALLAALPQIVQAVISAIPMIIAALASSLPQIIQAITAMILPVAEAIKAKVLEAWEAIKTGITTALTAIKTVITTIFGAIRTAIVTYVNAWRTVIVTVWNAIKVAVTAVVNGIKAVITTIFAVIRTVITTYVNAWRTIITTAWNLIKTVVTTAVNAVRTVVTRGFSLVRTAISTAFNAIKSVVSSAWNAVLGKMRSAVSAAAGIARSLPGKIRSALGSLYSVGANFVEGLWNGLKAKFDSVISWAREKAAALPEAVKKVLGIASPSVIAEREIGWMWNEGLMKGLSERTKELVATARAQVADVMGVYNTTLPTPGMPSFVSNASWGSSAVAASAGQTVVQQTINFNEPVTTPAQTARMLKDNYMYGMVGLT